MTHGDLVSDRGAEAGASAPASARPLAPVELAPLVEQPLVSILIPNRNYARFLPDAIDGLLAQSYRWWEAIVCDDGSDDGSDEVVTGYAARDDRIRLLRHDGSRGQAAAFNTAFAACSGDIVCFLDADDTAAPQKLERIVNAFGRASAGMLVHPLTMFDEQREIQRIPALTAFEQGWIAPRVLRRGGRWRWVPTSGVALRREVAALVLPMPVSGLRTSADTYLLVLAALLTPVTVVDEALGGYRRHGANVFARATIDAERARRAAENLRLVADEVNARLPKMGRDVTLRIENNLKYRELRFQVDLLEGDERRLALVRSYGSLMRAFVHDDLYGPVQKAWASVLYGVAVILPVARRGRWLSTSLSGSRAKELVRRGLGARRVRTAA